MTIPTHLSLHGFIATPPTLHFGDAGTARLHARAGIKQWRRETDGGFTELDPVYCDLVVFGKHAERAYQQLRRGDDFVASGYIHEFERGDGPGARCEEFVANQIGHDSFLTRYTVDRRQAEPPRSGAANVDAPAVGI